VQDYASIPGWRVDFAILLKEIRLDPVGEWRAPEQAGAANHVLSNAHQYNLLARLCYGQHFFPRIYSLTGKMWVKLGQDPKSLCESVLN
jgi:hypothetical protein